MKIVLVRHGETDWNKNNRLMGQIDIPLNNVGREQARNLREKLDGFDFDCCYSSPLSRARETAEIVCKGKCDIVLDDNLKERFCGELQGRVIDNLGDRSDDKTAETDDELLERAKRFFAMLKNDNNQMVIVVSHNGLLKNLRHCILGKPGKVDYSDWNLDNCSFEIFDVF